ncbi:MAG: hypothetical protein AUI14_25045 [Actinobacteria bacterium 13_2_20CM_2_71_6]|nr:MAG: hypothetical protein AUI14_25045 [Actinobacteria bacterium 13_2_20CM_2_71_6]
MARHNAQLTRRVVAALKLSGDETVVEFRPGPGVGLRLLAEALPNGRVIGVEPSPVMRAQAEARTRRFADRMEIIDAAAETITLPAGSIDAVCAVNNVQLWQPLPASLARVFQLLRPGGSMAIGITEHAVLADGGSAAEGHLGSRYAPAEAALRLRLLLRRGLRIGLRRREVLGRHRVTALRRGRRIALLGYARRRIAVLRRGRRVAALRRGRRRVALIRRGRVLRCV